MRGAGDDSPTGDESAWGRCRLWAALLGVTLAACVVPKPLWRTPCGMGVWGYPADGGLPPQWTPATVAEAEARTVEAMRATSDPRLRDMCQQINGWGLYAHPSPQWVDSYGRSVAGVTVCEYRASQAGAGDPRTWAVAHELVHAAQRCDPWGHETWVDAGIYRALESMGVE